MRIPKITTVLASTSISRASASIVRKLSPSVAIGWSVKVKISDLGTMGGVIASGQSRPRRLSEFVD